MATPGARGADMTWLEFTQRMQDDPIVLLPTGFVEQHGPHLPLLTDVILLSAVTETVAAHVATAFTQFTCGGDQALIPWSIFGSGECVGYSRRRAW